MAQQEQFQAFRSAFGSMLAHYRAQEWTDALAGIERLHGIGGAGQYQKLLAVFSSRISAYMATPPAPGWNGVFRAWSPAS